MSENLVEKVTEVQDAAKAVDWPFWWKTIAAGILIVGGAVGTYFAGCNSSAPPPKKAVACPCCPCTPKADGSCPCGGCSDCPCCTCEDCKCQEKKGCSCGPKCPCQLEPVCGDPACTAAPKKIDPKKIEKVTLPPKKHK